MQEIETNTAAQIIEKLAGIKEGTVADVPFVIVPNGFNVKTFENLLPPKALSSKASIAAHDVDGFVNYINRFKLSQTALFAALQPKPALRAYIDYHSPSAADLCHHVVSCAMDHSEEWKRWSEQDKTKLTQKEFGLFIEDNAKDVLTPSGGELLEMALKFSSLRSVTFGSSQRLQDGTVQFEYKEEEKTGDIKLPPKIELALPVFRGDKAAYKINARLKYQLKEAQLQIWYELERPDIVIDAAYKAVIDDVMARTEIAIFRGMPA